GGVAAIIDLEVPDRWRQKDNLADDRIFPELRAALNDQVEEHREYKDPIGFFFMWHVPVGTY
ncbi:MAG: hypothetical protein MUO63_12800, partial [Desulfobulbaceae bacterium]|nr:hypothetical protein [Desulfobulbaceae bacterium]